MEFLALLSIVWYFLVIGFVIKVIQMAYVLPRRIDELEKRLKRIEDKESK